MTEKQTNIIKEPALRKVEYFVPAICHNFNDCNWSSQSEHQKTLLSGNFGYVDYSNQDKVFHDIPTISSICPALTILSNLLTTGDLNCLNGSTISQRTLQLLIDNKDELFQFRTAKHFLSCNPYMYRVDPNVPDLEHHLNMIIHGLDILSKHVFIVDFDRLLWLHTYNDFQCFQHFTDTERCYIEFYRDEIFRINSQISVADINNPNYLEYVQMIKLQHKNNLDRIAYEICDLEYIAMLHAITLNIDLKELPVHQYAIPHFTYSNLLPTVHNVSNVGIEPAHKCDTTKLVTRDNMHFIENGDKLYPITNFKLEVKEKITFKSKTSISAPVITIRVTCDACETFDIQIKSSDIGNLVNKLQENHPELCYMTNKNSDGNILTNYVREKISNAKNITVYTDYGWNDIEGYKCYLHDGLRFEDNSIQINTKHTLKPTNKSSFNICHDYMNILSISNSDEIIIPCILFEKLSLLKHLFNEAGFSPNFLLFMCGQTGSFKTSVAKVLFNTFDEDANKISASFNDTAAALKQKCNKAHDKILLCDDLKPGATTEEQKDLSNKLEILSRLFGDNVGASKCNATADDTITLSPNGMCVITGEFAQASKSTMLRNLVLDINTDTFDKDVLTHFQSAPEILQAFNYNFLMFIESKFHYYVNFIDANFSNFQNSVEFKERRTSTMYACLIVTAHILADFLLVNSYFDEFSHSEFTSKCGHAIANALTASEETAAEAAPEISYISALAYLYESKVFTIAQSINDYNTSFDGYLVGSFVYFDSNILAEKMSKYQKQQGVKSYLDFNATKKILANKEYLITKECYVKGKKRKVYTHKTKAMKSTTFTCFDMDKIIVDLQNL